MTQAQDDALKRIDEIAREHFDAYVLAVEGEPSPEDGDPDESVDNQVAYAGGLTRALGLLVLATNKLGGSPIN